MTDVRKMGRFILLHFVKYFFKLTFKPDMGYMTRHTVAILRTLPYFMFWLII